MCVIDALATVRADPVGTADRIRQRLERYEGMDYTPAGTAGHPATVKVTKEGRTAVIDAINFLEQQTPLPGFCHENVLGLHLAAADHCSDIGAEGVASHVGSDGSSSWDRTVRYGRWRGTCGECLWYGTVEPWMDALSLVDDLIVDDGVLSRGHRLCVFDPDYNVAGVAVMSHQTYGNVVAIEFASGYTDDVTAVTRRQQSGPPKLLVDAEARAGESRTQWQLGVCKGCSRSIEGGKVVEAAGARWHASCFCCTQCQTSLVGVKQKKLEKGRVLCQACWVDKYAPTCFVCHGKIDGERVRKGDSYRHPTCHSCGHSTPPALHSKSACTTNISSPVKVLGKLTDVKTNMTQRSSPRTRSPRCPSHSKSQAFPQGEVESMKRTARIVQKYGNKGQSTKVGKPARDSREVQSSVYGIATSQTGKLKVQNCRSSTKPKPSFAAAELSLNSMAMGYGDMLC